MSDDKNSPDNKGKTKEINLPSGKVATILPGKGLHSRNAVKIINGDMSQYLNALMYQLVLIDGKTIVMEELDEMDIKDYNKLMAEFSNENFS